MTKKNLALGLVLAGVVGGASAQKLKDAQEAMTLEKYDQAKSILQKLVQSKSKVGENYFYLGQVYLVNDRVDSAKIVFEQGLANDPKQILNTVGLATVDLYSGNTSAAETKFAQATSNLGKKDYLPLYYAGEAYINAPKPDFTKAIEYLTQAKAKNAKDPQVPIALGDAYAGLRESNQAYISYRDALAIDGSLIQPKIGQAVISRWAQAYDQVIQDLNNLIQEHPDYAPLYRELADTYYYSSLQAPEDQYREINQKGIEAYKKYLEVSGDKSLDAKVRYADFLVYTGQYDELKKVSEELSSSADVDPKVFRYLGYIAFQQDKDYDKSKEYLGQLFSKVDTSRLIALDYLYAGLSELIVGDSVKGASYLKEAIAKQTEEDGNLEETIAETAFSKYQDGESDVAMKIFAVPASDPKSDFYFDSNYYLGMDYYSKGSKLYLGDGQEVEDNGAANLAAATPDLEKAIKHLDIVTKSTEERVVKQYSLNSIYYKGLAELALDNLQHNPEESTGLFVPEFEKVITELKDKADITDEQKGYLTDAYNYIGYYSYFKGDTDKAKSYFQETLKIDPENPTAKPFVEQL